jgi:small subunit ribosomal protein S8
MDPISNRISSLRQGVQRKKEFITLPGQTSKLICEVLICLRNEGYIRGYLEAKEEKTGFSNIIMRPSYSGRGESAVRNIFRISRPGRRQYVSTTALWAGTNPGPLSTHGSFILSTTQGIRTDREARLRGIGGEVLLGIYSL